MYQFQYDAIRCDQETAKKILKAFDSPFYPDSWTGDDLLSISEINDGTAIIEWETNYGSPWDEIEIPKTPLLHIYAKNDQNPVVEKYNTVPDDWMKDFKVINNDRFNKVNWKISRQEVDCQDFLGLLDWEDDD